MTTFSDKHQYQKEQNASPVKTRQEIANEYGITRHTLLAWLKKAHIKLPSGLVPPKYQKQIYEEFGYPKS